MNNRPLRLKLRTIIFYNCVFLAIAVIAFAQQTEFTGQAVISVESLQPGLPVLIDGQGVGFTPLRYFALSPGSHEIAVKRSRPESWLDYDWMETVTLQAGDTLELVARFLKGYSINSTPFGAEVYVNDILQGTTPLVLRLPEAEITPVEIRKLGYETVQLQIGQATDIEQDGRLHSVTLKEEKDYAGQREIEKSRRLFRLSRNRKVSLTAAGLSLASGVAAILLKQKADHYYEQYLTAGVPAEMDRLYDLTTQYDRYSGVATAVFEVSFAVSFYYFLKSTSE